MERGILFGFSRICTQKQIEQLHCKSKLMDNIHNKTRQEDIPANPKMQASREKSPTHQTINVGVKESRNLWTGRPQNGKQMPTGKYHMPIWEQQLEGGRVLTVLVVSEGQISWSRFAGPEAVEVPRHPQRQWRHSQNHTKKNYFKRN